VRRHSPGQSWGRGYYLGAMSDDNPSAAEIAAASVEIAAVLQAAASPSTYISTEKGPVEVSSMDPTWAKRAERAVIEGRRPLNVPRMVTSLDRRAGEA
jgi:hypothetical protein